MSIEEYVFDEGRICELSIFKLAEEPRRWPFVTEAFRKAVERNGLRGLDFVQVA